MIRANHWLSVAGFPVVSSKGSALWMIIGSIPTKRSHLSIAKRHENLFIARSAFYVLCARNRLRSMCVCLSVCVSVTKLVTNIHWAATGWPRSSPPVFWTKITKNPFFSLFLDQFQIKSTNTRPAFGDPKIVVFHCFWTRIRKWSHFCSYCVLRAPALQSVV